MPEAAETTRRIMIGGPFDGRRMIVPRTAATVLLKQCPPPSRNPELYIYHVRTVITRAGPVKYFALREIDDREALERLILGYHPAPITG